MKSPKKNNRLRAMGIFTSQLRLWPRFRREVCEEWELRPAARLAADTGLALSAKIHGREGGITGVLSRESFDSFIEKAESLQLALPAEARDGDMRLRVMVETVLLMANRQFYDLYLVAKLSQGQSTSSTSSSFAQTLQLIRRMLDEDEKKSALLAATEGTSGGVGVALPAAPSKDQLWLRTIVRS